MRPQVFSLQGVRSCPARAKRFKAWLRHTCTTRTAANQALCAADPNTPKIGHRCCGGCAYLPVMSEVGRAKPDSYTERTRILPQLSEQREQPGTSVGCSAGRRQRLRIHECRSFVQCQYSKNTTGRKDGRWQGDAAGVMSMAEVLLVTAQGQWKSNMPFALVLMLQLQGSTYSGKG